MELLIVGGGLAAQRCIEVLRAAGDDRAVTVVCDEPARPYDRPPLSKEGLHGAIDPSFRPEGWYADHGVELRLGAAARSLDATRRTVVLEDGERLRYDDLLIATGADARELPPLAGYDNVQTLRTLADAQRLRGVLGRGTPLAVVGAGLIGLEGAATASALGVDVTVVEAAPRPLQGILGPRAAAWLVALHRANGVVVRTGATVTRVLPSPEGTPQASSVAVARPYGPKSKRDAQRALGGAQLADPAGGQQRRLRARRGRRRGGRLRGRLAFVRGGGGCRRGGLLGGRAGGVLRRLVGPAAEREDDDRHDRDRRGDAQEAQTLPSGHHHPG
jgi:hypothetical protein